jgi:hypothetical protein
VDSTAALAAVPILIIEGRLGAAPPASFKTNAAEPDAQRKPQATPVLPLHNPLPTKIFFATTALALVLSTCTGIVMARKYARRKSAAGATLLAGILIPVMLLLI